MDNNELEEHMLDERKIEEKYKAYEIYWKDFQDWLWENHRLKTDWIAGKELKMYEEEYLEEEE